MSPRPRGALRARIARFIDSYGEQGDRVALALDLWACRWPTTLLPAHLRGSAPRASESRPSSSSSSGSCAHQLPAGGRPGHLPDQRDHRGGVVRLRDTDLDDRGARLHAERVVGLIPARGASPVLYAPDSSGPCVGPSALASCPSST